MGVVGHLEAGNGMLALCASPALTLHLWPSVEWRYTAENSKRTQRGNGYGRPPNCKQMVKPYYEEDGIVIYNADCREVLPQLAPVDLVVTDPPYGCGKAEWDSSFPTEWYVEAKRLAPTTCVITGSAGLPDSIKLVGADFLDVIAARNLNGMTRGPLGFGNWLAAVVAGTKPPQGINCFDFTVNGEMPAHPSPKPLRYMQKLLARMLPKGGSLIDPFMGSGTTLRAAKDLGLKAIGIELEKRYCEIAVQRLRQQVLQFA